LNLSIHRKFSTCSAERDREKLRPLPKRDSNPRSQYWSGPE